MPSDVPSEPWPYFRGLHDEAWDYIGSSFAEDVVFRWLSEEAATAKDWLASFAARDPGPDAPADQDDLMTLYAFSRAIEILTLGFQPGQAQVPAGVSPSEYIEALSSLGLSPTPKEPFTPFLHEIVTVDQAVDPMAPIVLVEELWPATMLGALLLVRAGVRVTAGARVADKTVAETSTLYWARTRKGRRCEDKSLGWGSNSQWATDLRRDYRLNGVCHLNVDGKQRLQDADLATDSDGLSQAERIELLTHRCFVTTAQSSNGLWPYEDRYAIAV